LQLRPVSSRELEAASELIGQTNQGQLQPALAEDLADSMRRWPTVQIGAFDGNDLIGLIAGRVDGADSTIGHSDDIVVKEQFRGTGLGSKLLQSQLDAFRALGCRRVRGLSPRSLYRALPFFERHGFKVIRRITAQGIWGIADGEEVSVTEKLL
jgi:GNAT superfamily N-acetyltransferase